MGGGLGTVRAYINDFVGKNLDNFLTQKSSGSRVNPKKDSSS